MNRNFKTEILASRYKFHKLLKRFVSLILPILLCSSEVWNPYRGYYFSTWDKTEVERVHLQFLKRLLGVLNISTRDIMVRETFRKDFDLFWSVKIRQTNKSLTYCMYKNNIIT